MKIIIANGPPKAGKDTLIGMLMNELDTRGRPSIYFSYKHVLCEMVGKRYGLSPDAVWKLNADSETKDEASDLFGGGSVRQALIYESEEILKKRLGDMGVTYKTFYNLGMRHGPLLNQGVLFSADGGFNAELDAVIGLTGISRKDVFVVRVDKDGRTFEGDSREYINDPDLVISNNGTIEDLKQYVKVFQEFLDS